MRTVKACLPYVTFVAVIAAAVVLFREFAYANTSEAQQLPKPAKQVNGAEQTHTVVAFMLEYKDEKPVFKPCHLHASDLVMVVKPGTKILLPGKKHGEPATLWRVSTSTSTFYNVEVLLEPESVAKTDRYGLVMHENMYTQYLMDITTLPKTISEAAE